VAEDASGATVVARPRVRRAPRDRVAATARAGPDHGPGARIVEELRRATCACGAARRAPAEVRAAAGHPMSSLTAVQAHSQALSILQ
jgi:hypothetical protein